MVKKNKSVLIWVFYSFPLLSLNYKVLKYGKCYVFSIGWPKNISPWFYMIFHKKKCFVSSKAPVGYRVNHAHALISLQL